MKNIIKTLAFGAVLLLSVSSCGKSLTGKQIEENLTAAGYTVEVMPDELIETTGAMLQAAFVLLGMEDVPEMELTYGVGGMKVDNSVQHLVIAYEFTTSDAANFLNDNYSKFAEVGGSVSSDDTYKYLVTGNCFVGYTDDTAKADAGL